MTTPAPSTLQRLADFVASARFEDLPHEVVEAAQLRVLDLLGSALWGVNSGTAAAMRRTVEPAGGRPEATVLGRGMKLPAPSAAYLNSSASPALLDTCRFSVTHPGIVTVPAALAAAQLAQANGRDFLLAVVLGYEILIRLGLHARVAERGFVPTALLGPFAAAAASARLLRLNADMTAHALAISAGMGAGLLEAYSAIDSARSQFGRASQGGLLAALLAQQGVAGNRFILEGGSMEATPGFFQAFGQEVDTGKLTRDLGADWGILRVAPKIHDGCRYTNAAADATQRLMREQGLTADRVAHIRIGTFALALEVSVRNPTTVSGALFCMEFVVATALLCGDVFNHRFTADRLSDPEVRGLMAKVSVALDPQLQEDYPQRLGLRMEVETTDGRTLRTTIDFPRGEPENPLTRSDCEQKFQHLARPLLGADRAGAVLDQVQRLHALASLDPVLDLCAPEAAHAS
jgi:2-methylcitrate dehydratase PrpD